MDDLKDHKLKVDSKDHKLKVYEQLCNSYRAIDDFRTKLLALLPLATGGGIFLLVGDETRTKAIEAYLPSIGFFGFMVTLGLSLFEPRNTEMYSFNKSWSKARSDSRHYRRRRAIQKTSSRNFWVH